jgi:hypothetical protein
VNPGNSFPDAPLDPVNLPAAAMHFRGIKPPPYTVPPHVYHSGHCPELAPKLALRKLASTATWRDFTGHTIGRFTVIGLSRDDHSRWVVRCSCGQYELRSAKSLRNPNNTGDCCLACRHAFTIKRHSDWHTRRQRPVVDPINPLNPNP